MPLRLGFACVWDKIPESTWSGTPWGLRKALTCLPDVDLVDMPMRLREPVILFARAIGARIHHNKLRSTWRFGKLTWNEHQRALEKAMPRIGVDAVLTIGLHGTANAPTFVYQDIALPHLLKNKDVPIESTFQFSYYSPRMLQKHNLRHINELKKIHGVFTMSEWDRQGAIAAGVITPSNIHNVGAGVNVSGITAPAVLEARRVPKVLFIGRDFFRKGGDILLQAMRILNSHKQCNLIIAGPKSWQEISTESKPEYIQLLGDVPHEVLEQQLLESDLLVLPSKFEAFGISVIEALCAGIPVVGVKNFAMPEMIEDYVTGRLISEYSGQDLAVCISDILNNSSYREAAQQRAASARYHWSWDRVAADIVRIINQTLENRT